MTPSSPTSRTTASARTRDSDTEAPWTLSPGEALTCTFTVNHTGDYYSSWTNSVYVTAVDEDGVDLSDTSNTQTVDLSDVSTPLTIVKTTESASTLPEPGGDFDFKVVVTNPSTFDDVTVSDLDDTFLADLQDNGVCEDEDSRYRGTLDALAGRGPDLHLLRSTTPATTTAPGPTRST